jgi:hypothetical protein
MTNENSKHLSLGKELISIIAELAKKKHMGFTEYVKYYLWKHVESVCERRR